MSHTILIIIFTFDKNKYYIFFMIQNISIKIQNYLAFNCNGDNNNIFCLNPLFNKINLFSSKKEKGKI